MAWRIRGHGTSPFDAKGLLRMVEAADYGPDYQLDALKEIQESWILLMPGTLTAARCSYKPRQCRPELTRWLGVGVLLACRTNYEDNWPLP